MESSLFIAPGTPKAMALLETLRSEGLLVDIYSREFFKRQPRPGDPKYPEAPFYSDGMEYIEACEADREGLGIFPKGHLWIVWLDPHSRNFDAIQRSFEDLFPPLLAQFCQRDPPDFLIFNLFTQQILAVGLMRGNHLSVVDVSTGDAVDPSVNEIYFSDFTAHDAFDATMDLLNAMSDLARGLQLFHRLPSNPEFVQLGIDKGPDQKGDYFIVDYEGGLVDDCAFSLAELEEIAQTFQEALDDIDHSRQVINAFFPSCDVWDLDAH